MPRQSDGGRLDRLLLLVSGIAFALMLAILAIAIINE
jgi:hypothetical protein